MGTKSVSLDNLAKELGAWTDDHIDDLHKATVLELGKVFQI